MYRKESKKKELERKPLDEKMKLLSIVIVKNEYGHGSGYKKRARTYSKSKFRLPGIGVGVFLANLEEDKILLGRRRDSGLFGLPGGWLEMGEEWENCASRELKEETGLVKQPSTFRHVHTLNCKFLEVNYHNISCIMYNEVEPGDLKMIINNEPNKCAGWFWVTFTELRAKIDRLFYPLRDFLGKFPDLKNVSYLKSMIKNTQASQHIMNTTTN